MNIDTINIRHQFTDAEMAELGRESARHLGELQNAEQSAKSVAAQFKADVEAAKGKVNAVSSRIREGWEMRDVKALVLKDRFAGFALSIRLDTGAILKRRKIEEHERQMTLSTEPPKPFFAVIVLPVEDPDWKDADAAPLPVYEDEFDKLKSLPAVIATRPWVDHPAIESAPPTDQKANGKSKGAKA